MPTTNELFGGVDLLFKNPGFTAILGALIVTVANLLLDRRSHIRWLADHFLSRKLDALSTFWVAVAEWHDVVVEKHSEWGAGKYDPSWADILAPFPSKCLRALRVAQPFLDREQFKTFKVLCNGLELAGMQVLVNRTAPGFQEGELATKSREMRWANLETAYDKAVDRIGELLGRKLVNKVTAGV